MTNEVVLKFSHASLQFNDTDRQHTHDISAIFSRDSDIITGTEAGRGAGNTARELKRLAKEKGYFLSRNRRYDTWVAVKQTIVMPGTWSRGSTLGLLPSRQTFPRPPGRWNTMGLVWGQFRHAEAGWISVGAVHYVTHKAAGPNLKDRLDKRYSRIIGRWAVKHGRRSRLAFVAGDMNRDDRKVDPFFGQPLTTCWDEIGKWPPTQKNGTIDVIASYDRDSRVRCLTAQSLPDSKVPLFTDHYLVEALYAIKKL